MGRRPTGRWERQRGRGYAGAVTDAVSRTAREAGAGDVLRFADLGRPVGNGRCQRFDHLLVRDHASINFSGRVSEGPRIMVIGGNPADRRSRLEDP